MTAYRIDHVGVAVPSIDEALAVYRALGLVEERREEVAGQQVIAAFLPVGDSRVELLEATSADSPIAKFLARRGAGLHHVCFAVDDLDAALRDLAGRGFRLIHREGIPGAGGKRIAFLHPESAGGVLIELAERPSPPPRPAARSARRDRRSRPARRKARGRPSRSPAPGEGRGAKP